MTIEALVVSGAEKRPSNLLGIDHRLVALDALSVLRRGPAAIALVPAVLSPTGPLGARIVEKMEQAAQARGSKKSKEEDEVVARSYRDIARKNIFQGAPTVEKQEFYATGDDIEVTRYTYLTDITLSDWRSEAWIFMRTNNRKTRLRVSPGFNSFLIKDDHDEVHVNGKVVKIDSRDIYFQVGSSYYAIHVGQSFAEAMRRRLAETDARSLGLLASEGNPESSGKTATPAPGRPTSVRGK
jgi:hypothetical protein